MKRLALLLAFLLTFSIAFAKIDYFGIDSQIVSENSASIKLTIYKAKEFSFKFYGVIRNISSNVNCLVEGELVKCKAENETSMNVQIFSDIVSKAGNTYSFSITLEISEDVKRVTSIVTLPVGMILENETNSVYPSNFKTLSNGRNILVYWEIENVSSLQPLTFRVKYQSVTSPETSSKFYLIVLVLIAITLIVSVYALKKRKVVIKKIVRVKPEKVVVQFLDEYERKVYEVVKEKGKIKQNEIVQITGFSKARVSRVVKKLAERGLIKVEKRGKTNLISLRS
ncbi:MAG: helix-turn-helix transcriptional regulator [Candidatus Aenigmatarchaeota archaeon]